MNLATWSIRNPIPSILFFFMITVAGLYGFAAMPIQGLPDVELPAVTVTLTLPGAAPSQIEREIVRKIETSIATISGVKHVSATIIDGQATVNIRFVLEKPLSDALIETKDAVDGIRADLPVDLQPPTVTAIAEAARRRIGDVRGVEHVFTAIGVAQAAGRGLMLPGETRNGALTVTFSARGARASQTEIENEIRRRLWLVPGARFTLSTGNAGEKMSVNLSSDNVQPLDATARRLVKEMRGLSLLANVNSSADMERPEIHIRPDPERAAELGVTTATIGEFVRVATVGAFNMQLPKLNLDNRQIYIRVQLPADARRDIDTISDLRVPARGGLAALETVADISIGAGPAQISRYDRRRVVTVNADLAGTPLGRALAEVKRLPAIRDMPKSVKLLESGNAETMNELFANFGIAILSGVLCVFCVLALLFEDFFHPLTILSALPLSLGGSIFALLATRQQLSLPALIGIVMLIGVASKNSILLAEYAMVCIRGRGMGLHDALLDACRKRARPIVMTTVAMIAGMTPIALDFSGDSSFRQPMAIAVIGGLVTATALSLLVVPVAFTYIDGLERRLRSLVARWTGISSIARQATNVAQPGR
jgi:multidrug efflux pump subunit AcrB